jgi:hypothetical protein
LKQQCEPNRTLQLGVILRQRKPNGAEMIGAKTMAQSRGKMSLIKQLKDVTQITTDWIREMS